MIQALREILAVFKVDNTSLKKGIGEGNKLVDGLKDALGALTGPLTAALSGGAIVAFAHDLIEGADAASKMADSLGLGIVELQGWQHAADMSGVASEQLSVAFTKLQHGLAEVADKGKGPAAEALEALGIEAKDSEKKLKSSSRVLEEVADAIQGLDADARNAQLMKLFGEQGAKLVPLLKGGSAGVRALRSEVEELGFAFDDGFAASAEEFNDNMTRLTKAGQGFLLQVLGPMMPDLVDLTEELVRGAKAAIPMVKSLVTFARESTVLKTAVVALTGKGLLAGIGATGKWMKTVGGLSGVLKTLTGTVFRLLLPLVALDEVVGFLSGDDSLIGDWLDEQFGEGTADKVRDLTLQVGDFVAMFVTAPDEVRRAFASLPADLEQELGPLGEYVGVLLEGIVDTFLFTTDVLTGDWQNFTDKFAALGDWGLAALSIVWTELKFLGLGVAADLSDGYAGAWNGIVAGAQRVLQVVGDLASNIPGFGGDVSDGLKALSGTIGGAAMNTDAGEVVQKQLNDARLAIAADLESAQSRMIAPQSSTTNNVTQDVTQTTQVNVTVPPGTPATVADRVGKAAARGAAQGSARNLRATQDALVPRPAG